MSRIDDLLSAGSSLLVALPTADTFRRLQEMMGASPIGIEWNELCLEICYSEEGVEWTVKPDALYEVTFIKFGILYDQDLGRSQLSGHAVCPALSRRVVELGLPPKEYFTVVFKDGAELARTNKSFIESISYTICARQDNPFTFGPEMLVTA